MIILHLFKTLHLTAQVLRSYEAHWCTIVFSYSRPVKVSCLGTVASLTCCYPAGSVWKPSVQTQVGGWRGLYDTLIFHYSDIQSRHPESHAFFFFSSSSITPSKQILYIFLRFSFFYFDVQFQTQETAKIQHVPDLIRSWTRREPAVFTMPLKWILHCSFFLCFSFYYSSAVLL